MSSILPFALNRLWLKWKSLKLPWRKRWLAGSDLSGNTFWYFKAVMSSTSARRILQHNPKVPYSDIQISPQWHQWLRYTRATPPTIAEQQADAFRQSELKRLVQAADARWAAKPSLLDKPRPRKPELRLRDGQGEAARPTEKQNDSLRELQKEHSGQAWQPEAWSPQPLKK